MTPLLLFALFLLSCIQGPWDYYPRNRPNFKGIWVTGYLIGDKPIENFCLERFFDLTEEYTNAFAFFDSADVRITGDFNGTKTIALVPNPEKPNCFLGARADLPAKGADYDLQVTVWWDSSGEKVRSVLSARAHVPSEFSLEDTAKAPALTAQGLLSDTTGDSTIIASFTKAFQNMPVGFQEEFSEKYGDTLVALRISGASDSVVLAYFVSIQRDLTAMLERYPIKYGRGDSLYYLSGVFNTLSHYFDSRRSADVGAVLITHRYKRSSSKPETAFDGIFGLKPDTADFNFPGDLRRLIIYPQAVGPAGWNLLDSMGVVNSWFMTDTNVLYFYGMEANYFDFIQTNVDEETNPRIKKFSNITGGMGIFSGGLVDSFHVIIRVDSQTNTYPLYNALAASCRQRGWESHQGCREFYPQYCKDIQWKHKDCDVDLIRSAYLNRWNLDSILLAHKLDSASYEDNLKEAGERFCIENNFPDSISICARVRIECNSSLRTYSCKQNLWNYCLDNKWKPAQCGLGLVSYCLDRPRQSEVLCRNADSFCVSNPSEPLCQEANRQ